MQTPRSGPSSEIAQCGVNPVPAAQRCARLAVGALVLTTAIAVWSALVWMHHSQPRVRVMSPHGAVAGRYWSLFPDTDDGWSYKTYFRARVEWAYWVSVLLCTGFLVRWALLVGSLNVQRQSTTSRLGGIGVWIVAVAHLAAPFWFLRRLVRSTGARDAQRVLSAWWALWIYSILFELWGHLQDPTVYVDQLWDRDWLVLWTTVCRVLDAALAVAVVRSITAAACEQAVRGPIEHCT